jgi:predicted RNA-binding Zn-ribbon protein involved in translation (DUF1610 family)
MKDIIREMLEKDFGLNEKQFNVWYKDPSQAELQKMWKPFIADDEAEASQLAMEMLDREAPGHEFEIAKVELVKKAKESKLNEIDDNKDYAFDKDFVTWFMEKMNALEPEDRFDKTHQEEYLDFKTAQNLIRNVYDWEAIQDLLDEFKAEAAPERAARIKAKESKLNEMPKVLRKPMDEPEDDKVLDRGEDEEEEQGEELAPELPDEEAAEIDFEKLYLGRTEDKHFYIVADKSEHGEVEDLKAVDQEGELVFSAVDNHLDLSDLRGFIETVIDETDIAQIERNVVMQYIIPEVEAELDAEEEEDEILEPDEVLSQDEEPEKKEPKLESKVKEKNKKIDLFIDGKYYASTNQSKTCKQAVDKLKTMALEKGAGGKFKYNTYGPVRKAIEVGKKITARFDESKKNSVRESIISFEDTEIHTWFERDRSHVELRDKNTDKTLAQWWDEDVRGAVEDGYLNPKDWHTSAYEYYREMNGSKEEGKMKDRADEGKMGVDYMKRAKSNMRQAAAAMKEKDLEAAAKYFQAVADESADAAKALGKMKLEADEKAALEKEKEVSEEQVEEMVCPSCGDKHASPDYCDACGTSKSDWEEESKVDESMCPKCECAMAMDEEKGCFVCPKCGGVDETKVDEKCPKGKKKVKETDIDETLVTDDKGNSFSVNLVDENEKHVTMQVNDRTFHFATDFAALFGADENGRITDEGLQELALETLKNLDETDYAELVGSGKPNESKVKESATKEEIERALAAAKAAYEEDPESSIWPMLIRQLEDEVELPSDSEPLKTRKKKDWPDHPMPQYRQESKKTVDQAVEEKLLEEGAEVTYNGKTGKLSIVEGNVTVSVMDDVGGAVDMNVNGEAYVSISPEGAITIDPAPAPVELPMVEPEMGEEEPMGEPEEEEPMGEELPPEEGEEEEELPFESKVNETSTWQEMGWSADEIDHSTYAPDLTGWMLCKDDQKVKIIKADEKGITYESPEGGTDRIYKLADMHDLGYSLEDPEGNLVSINKGEPNKDTNEGDYGITKGVFNVKYVTKDGEEKETRVTGYDEADAKEYMIKNASVAKVTDVKKVTSEGAEEDGEYPDADSGSEVSVPAPAGEEEAPLEEGGRKLDLRPFDDDDWLTYAGAEDNPVIENDVPVLDWPAPENVKTGVDVIVDDEGVNVIDYDMGFYFLEGPRNKSDLVAKQINVPISVKQLEELGFEPHNFPFVEGCKKGKSKRRTKEQIEADKIAEENAEACGGTTAVETAERLLGLDEPDVFNESIAVGDIVQICTTDGFKCIHEQVEVKAIDEKKGVEITGSSDVEAQDWYGSNFYEVFKVF